MDGCAEEKSQNVETFVKYYSMGVETGHNAIKNQKFNILKVRFLLPRLFILNLTIWNIVIKMNLKSINFSNFLKKKDEEIIKD